MEGHHVQHQPVQGAARVSGEGYTQIPRSLNVLGPIVGAGNIIVNFGANATRGHILEVGTAGIINGHVQAR
jgi:hypothetical protein